MTEHLSVHEAQPRVCVVVLNYNGRRHLEYCLPSIRDTAYESLRVIVVDNASSDDSLDYVRREFPEMTRLSSPRNLGWAGGNNLGIDEALRQDAEYVVLANNDIRVDPRWVAAAVEVAQGDPRIGIVGFRVLEPAEPGDTTAFDRAVAEWTNLEYADTPIVDGMAMCIRADALARIGPIDEDFFAYAEDNDLVLRFLGGRLSRRTDQRAGLAPCARDFWNSVSYGRLRCKYATTCACRSSMIRRPASCTSGRATSPKDACPSSRQI